MWKEDGGIQCLTMKEHVFMSPKKVTALDNPPTNNAFVKSMII